MTRSLKQRAAHSGKWVIAGHFTSQLLRLGSNLVLTRLLVPEMFGVMAMVTVIMGGLAMFSDVGLLQNIVQSKRGEEKDYLNTAWTIQIIRGFVIFLIALALSYGLYLSGQYGLLSSDTVYGNVDLPLILAIVSISAIIASFNSIHILVLNRKLMMSKLIIIDLLSQIIGLIFMLIWAWFHRDIWALVFGGILGALVKMLLTHTLNIGEPCKFRWDKDAVGDIFHFGKWIFLSSIFGFLLNQGDRILLGGLISPEMLGVYTVAFFLANALKDIITKLISSVFYPVLSETLRNSPENLESTYYKIRNKIDAIAFFSAGFIFASGEAIVSILYDSRYQDAGWMLQVLSLSLIGAGSLLASQYFLSRGKPKLETLLVFVQVTYFYLVMPVLFYFYGITGSVIAIASYPILRLFLSMFLMKKFFFFNLNKELIMLPLIAIGFWIGNIVANIII
tara:strand:+ start:3335 stop:4681 length:1347 start_codon:yes stop_codon:yes gene_type:complete